MPLLGRDEELALLAELLRSARGGTSGALVLAGEPGMGKTSLLRHAVAEAAELRVLSATGLEAESDLPYAGLADLLEPVLGLLPAIPERQAAALAGSLALGPPVHGDRFAVAAATLSLLSAAADAQPVLVVVDDAQWLDASSVEALVFAARRLRAEGVAVLLGVRRDTPGAARFTGLPHHVLRPLDDATARLLLAQVHGDGLSQAAVDALVQTAGGNPLGLRELPQGLDPDQLAGRDPLRGPLAVGPALEEAFRDRLDGLPAPTLDALLVVATSDTPLLEVLEPALQQAGARLSDLEPAEARGLVKLHPDRVGFSHPLMRSVVHQAAAPARRRWAHGLLASSLLGAQVPQAAERRAWHLIAATVRPDAAAADAVEQVARSAAARRSFTTAAMLFERAARLSPDPRRRGQHLLAAALAAVPAGRVDEALRLLEGARADTDDPLERGRIEHHRWQLEMWSTSPAAARDRLFALAQEVEPLDRALAAQAVISASQASILVYDYESVLRGAERAGALAEPEAREQLMACVLQAFGLAQSGRCADALGMLDEAWPALLDEEPLTTDQLVLQAGVCYLALEGLPRARTLLERAVHSSREANAAGALAMQLPWLTTLRLAEGDWNAALAEAHDALRLVEETGWLTYRPTCLSVLARVEAGRGSASCRVHSAAAVRSALELGEASVAAHAHAALGLLELGLGAPAAAADELEQGLRLVGDRASPLLRVQLLPDLVEACVRADRRARASELLEELEAGAQCTGRRASLALAARCRALLGDRVEDSLRHALHLHAQGTPAFDRARTQLLLGQVLRRCKRRAEARELLVAARETFLRLGAQPWAARVETDVVALGGTRRSGDAAVAHSLTPQELHVALTAARGLSNAETASALFLSIKTVEFHLSNVYRKLGVRSRTQLVHRLSLDRPEDDAAPTQPGPSLAP